MISENEIKAQSEYMQMFGCERHSFEAGVRWAMTRITYPIVEETVKFFKVPPAEISENEKCAHERIEEIQGEQVEISEVIREGAYKRIKARCLDCGETWE